MRIFFDWSGHPLSHDRPGWGVSAVEGAAPVFRHLPAPTGAELQELAQQIAARTAQGGGIRGGALVARPPGRSAGQVV